MNTKIGLVILTVGLASAGTQAVTNDNFSITGYASFDVASSYVIYGARLNDEPCLWSYGELTLGYGEYGAISVALWQNTDLTSRRSESMGRMNEWDWEAFYRGGLDLTDGWRLQLEAGHIWYKYHHIRSVYREVYATMEEWVGRLTLVNPYVTPYFEYYYDHKVTHGKFMQGGLKKPFELVDGFVFTSDLTLGGGDNNYNACLYPPYDGSGGGGIAFVQLAGTFAYWINAHFGVHAKIAYTVMTNDEIREAMDAEGEYGAKDFVWGSVGVDFAF